MIEGKETIEEYIIRSDKSKGSRCEICSGAFNLPHEWDDCKDEIIIRALAE